jgi:parallel beta helix pectate lyase-like protein
MSRLRFVVAIALAVPAIAPAATLRVPTVDYPTVRRAVFLAQEGDTVLVAAGSYQDRFTLRDKNIVLLGEAGAENTTIDGSNALGNVITLSGSVVGKVTRSTIVEGLTITGGAFAGHAAPESVGAGVYCNRASPTIRKCIFSGNDSNAAGGVSGYFFSNPLVEDCWISDNQGGGIYLETDNGISSGQRAEIRNCTIVNNTGFGIWVLKGARALIEDCTIAYNTANGVLSEITVDGGTGKCYVTLQHSLVTNNSGAGVIRRDLGVCFTLYCNDVWSNGPDGPGANSEWVGWTTGDPCFNTGGRGQGDVSFDPQYTDPAGRNYKLLPSSNLLRAWCQPNSCGVPGANNVCPQAVTSTTWGEFKQRYR